MAEESSRDSAKSGIIFDVVYGDVNKIELFFPVIDKLTGVHIDNLKHLVDKFLRVRL